MSSEKYLKFIFYVTQWKYLKSRTSVQLNIQMSTAGCCNHINIYYGR